MAVSVKEMWWAMRFIITFCVWKQIYMLSLINYCKKTKIWNASDPKIKGNYRELLPPTEKNKPWQRWLLNNGETVRSIEEKCFPTMCLLGIDNGPQIACQRMILRTYKRSWKITQGKYTLMFIYKTIACKVTRVNQMLRV